MRLLVTRPEPDAARQAKTLRRRNHVPIVSPVMRTVLLPDVSLALDDVGALVVTSRNALRALSERDDLDRLRAKPLYAVGAATARLAREQGFGKVVEGPGTGDGLAALIAEQFSDRAETILHLSGEELSFDMEAALGTLGIGSRRAILYRTEPAESLTVEAQSAIAAGGVDGVIVMSARTARYYAQLVEQADLWDRAVAVPCYCLSAAVADAIMLDVEKRVSPMPHEDSLLALIDEASGDRA